MSIIHHICAKKKLNKENRYTCPYLKEISPHGTDRSFIHSSSNVIVAYIHDLHCSRYRRVPDVTFRHLSILQIPYLHIYSMTICKIVKGPLSLFQSIQLYLCDLDTKLCLFSVRQLMASCYLIAASKDEWEANIFFNPLFFSSSSEPFYGFFIAPFSPLE